MKSIVAKPHGYALLLAAGLCLAGGALIAAALFAGPLGLSFEHDFVLYRWFALTRRETALWGAGIAVAGGCAALALRYLPNIGRKQLVAATKNTSIVLLSIIACLVGLEVIVRLMDDVRLSWPTGNLVAEQQNLLRVHTLNDDHPVLGWTLKPGLRLHADDPKASFTTGEHGIRMNDAAIRPLPRDAFLAVGDSFTASSEVGDRHTWPAYLDRLLGQPVINAGVGGFAADQIILRAELLIPLVKPRAVIVSFYEDDVARAGYRVNGGANKPWFSIDRGKLRHQNNPVPVFTGRREEIGAPWLGYSHLVSWALKRLGYGDWWRQLNTSYVRADNDSVDVTCQLLTRLKRITDRLKIALLLLAQYGGNDRLSQLSPRAEIVKVLGCARARVIDILDSCSALVAASRRGAEKLRRLYVMHDDDRRMYSHMSSAREQIYRPTHLCSPASRPDQRITRRVA